MSTMAKIKRHRWFAVFVILPVLIATFYYGFVASDVYVSESRFVIKSPGQRQTQLSTIANLIQTTGLSSGQEQTNEVIEYLRSRNALTDLSQAFKVEDAYRNAGADALSRFPQPFREDRFESFYRYFQGKVDARLEAQTGMAVLTVRAFRPEDAQKINAGLLDLSERMVNRLNDRAQTRAIVEAESRVTNAEDRVRKARLSLRQYRNSEALIDPAKQAVGVLDLSNKLVAEQASLKAQLEQIERVAPANPAIPALRNRIAAIGEQIAAQTGRAVGTRSGIASKMSGYENLEVEQEFATQALAAANTAREQARVESQKQQFYLERVVSPNKPDLALLPNRLRAILTIAAACLCLYVVGWMLIVGILEHAPED